MNKENKTCRKALGNVRQWWDDEPTSTQTSQVVFLFSFLKKMSLCNRPIEGVGCVLEKKKDDCVTDAMPSENSSRGIAD